MTSPLITGMYWRKNLWNGAATVPVLLGFENGTLTLEDAKTTVFAAPITTVSARLTAWKTLVITVDGTKYDFVGTGSSISSGFTAEQRAKLAAQSMSAPGLGQVGGAAAGAGVVLGQVADAGLGAATQAAGAGASVVGFLIGAKAMGKWKELFTQVGVFVG